MSILSTIRPLPYYTVAGHADFIAAAQSLRRELVPKIARRLPGHHLAGMRHDAVINFVKRHKKKYPCFIRTDIAKFYPTVSHRDLLVGMQLAYRDLLGLEYVPKAFKRRYVGIVNRWIASLPLHRGIPLGSPLSALLAPLMLVPLWLELKRRYRLPFLVYMDDVLVMCGDEDECAEIYAFIANRLSDDYGLSLNIDKTVSGRFSRQSVVYCGWRFSGGYATISNEKVAAFKDRLTAEVDSCKGMPTSQMLKRVNRKIDGFGNYYKHGDVARQLGELDAFVRREVRRRLSAENKAVCHTNDSLQTAGLHSLRLCYEKAHRAETKKQPTPGNGIPGIRKQESPGSSELEVLTESAGKIIRQLVQLVALQRKQLRIMEAVCV